jgi:hypothetical protein
MGDILFMAVLSDTCPLKCPTILITVMRIEQMFTAHNSLTNGCIIEGEANIAENKLLTDTCSLGYPIKRYNDAFFPTLDSDRQSETMVNLKTFVSGQV